MSTPSDFELDLDLEFLPAWARQPSTVNRYAKFEGEPEGDRRGFRGDRPGRPEGRRDRPPFREGGPGGGPRREGPRGGRDRDRGFEPRRPERRPEAAEPPPPPLELNVTVVPEETGVESLARRLKLTGRAYPLFYIAGLVLERPDRYHVTVSVKRGPEGQVLQPLFACSLDESLWLESDEVVAHVLGRHFATFYQAERVPTDPPKGVYTFVAQCGLSGAILGPPNFHDYQTKLRKLHAERFARMPFDTFKSRVKIVRDEAVVKKWVEEQSYKTDYVCLNVPESLRLSSREDVERHFREIHLANLVKPVDEWKLAAGPSRPPMSPRLHGLLRQTVEDLRRFPLPVAMRLSQQFAGHGLQFFKVNKTVTHVCVARPHYLVFRTTVVSEGVRRIVEFVDRANHCTRRRLLEALAPSPAPITPLAPATEAAAPAGGSPAPAPAAPAEAPPPTPEQTAVISDLHWLIHQGHVIEFSDGKLEIAQAPKLKPPPPPRPAAAAPPAAPAVAAETAGGALASPAPTAEPPAGEALAAAEPAAAIAPAETGPAPEATAAPAPPEAETPPSSGAPSEPAPVPPPLAQL